MRFHCATVIAVITLCCAFASAQVRTSPGPAPATRPADPPAARSKIVAVTVYLGTALVTREVDVPEGKDLVEVIVSPLPEQTVDSSLYTESTDGIRVLSTRIPSDDSV